MKIKIALIIVFFTILQGFSVHAGYTVRIDTDNDGDIDRTIADVDDLEWQIFFQTYGGKQISTSYLPTLTLSGHKSRSVSNQDIPWDFTPPTHYRANWGTTNIRVVAGNPEHRYYTFDHWPGYVENISKENVGPGVDGCSNCIYNIDMISYGDGYNHDSEDPQPAPWLGISCATDPIDCWGSSPQRCAHLEYQNATCRTYTYGGLNCTACYNNPNNCMEKDYFCNGVRSEIKFYDGTTLELTINSSDWGDSGDVNYSSQGFIWWTDGSPGTIDISQTIRICKDECNPGQTGCNSATQEWICELNATDKCYDRVPYNCDPICESCSGSSCSIDAAKCTDCGLRVRHTATQTVSISCDLEPSSWPLKIQGKDGNTYGLVLVLPTDPSATNVSVQTSAGTRALRKYP